MWDDLKSESGDANREKASQPEPPQPPVSAPPHSGTPAPPPPETRRSGGAFQALAIGCLVAVLVGFAVFGLIFVALIVLSAATMAGGSGYATLQDGVPLQEVSVSGDAGAPKIVLVPVRGLLLPGATLGPDPARVLEAMLDEAAGDDRVEAVVLQVDSPGGGITTCDIMLKHLRDFKAESGLPVVALLGDVAASGGYYVACGADRIMAHPTTTTGSIGVMMPLYDVSALLKRFGVEDRTVTSAEYKDLASPFALKTEEQREKEREILEELVMYMHGQFVDVVAAGRGMPREQAETLADGRVFTSERAEAGGLIDSIGYREDAIELAKKLGGVPRAHVVRYVRARSLKEMIFMKQEGGRARSALEVLPEVMASPRPMYLWCPQAGMPAD